jgi:3-oxoacyl-[acyl-carrier-protein] synthase II
MQPDPIHVTGLGVVSPYGLGTATFWDALLDGRDAISPLTLFDTQGYLYQKGGQVPVDVAGSLRSRWPEASDRATLFALAACSEALEQARLSPEDRRTTALVTATNFASLASGEALLAVAAGVAANTALDGPALLDGDPSRGCRQLAASFGLGGPAAVLSLSCSSGTAALARAAEWIRAGRVERVLVVGYDALSRFAWSGLCALRTMSTDAVRPFDARRSGTIFSEGAAALVLERAGVARARSAALAELRGWATGNNGTHMTAPAPQGAGSADVMRRALVRGGLRAEEIDHFNAHGTATPLNDPTEAAALHTVLGDRASAIPTTSIKGAAGHLMGAAGCAEAIASVLALCHGLVPPTANHAELAPDCPLDVVSGAPRRAAVNTVLSNSAGIGGTNAAVVFTRAKP